MCSGTRPGFQQFAKETRLFCKSSPISRLQFGCISVTCPPSAAGHSAHMYMFSANFHWYAITVKIFNQFLYVIVDVKSKMEEYISLARALAILSFSVFKVYNFVEQHVVSSWKINKIIRIFFGRWMRLIGISVKMIYGHTSRRWFFHNIILEIIL